MRDHLVRTRTWPVGTYARSSPYWLTLQRRKARGSRPVSGVFRGTDTNVECWVKTGWDRYERNLNGWRLGVYLDADCSEPPRPYWVATYARPLDPYGMPHSTNGFAPTLAEAMKACEEAAK